MLCGSCSNGFNSQPKISVKLVARNLELIVWACIHVAPVERLQHHPSLIFENKRDVEAMLNEILIQFFSTKC